jgi:hypothetical protein
VVCDYGIRVCLGQQNRINRFCNVIIRTNAITYLLDTVRARVLATRKSVCDPQFDGLWEEVKGILGETSGNWPRAFGQGIFYRFAALNKSETLVFKTFAIPCITPRVGFRCPLSIWPM